MVASMGVWPPFLALRAVTRLDNSFSYEAATALPSSSRLIDFLPARLRARVSTNKEHLRAGLSKAEMNADVPDPARAVEREWMCVQASSDVPVRTIKMPRRTALRRLRFPMVIHLPSSPVT